jgi:predicted NAD/FAD-dependent oxidoreductase
VNSTKPGRNHDQTTIVVHTSNSWAQQHVDDALPELEKYLLEQLTSVLHVELRPEFFSMHRWRYAMLLKAHDDHSRDVPFYDQHLKLAGVGDWGSRSRIEDVWLEANLLADLILA